MEMSQDRWKTGRKQVLILDQMWKNGALFLCSNELEVHARVNTAGPTEAEGGIIGKGIKINK